MGEERGGCIVYWWGNRRKEPLGRPRRRWWIILGWIEKNEMGWACGAYG